MHMSLAFIHEFKKKDTHRDNKDASHLMPLSLYKKSLITLVFFLEKTKKTLAE